VKQIEVTLMGNGYVLACPEGGEALLSQAVAAVDQEMTHIRDSGKVKARERIAVLAALNLAYQLAEAGNRAARPTHNPAAPAAEKALAIGDIDIDGLLRRIDAALGDDGQLL
jgi:cell division protein ZapA